MKKNSKVKESRSKIVAKLDSVFSEYIRRRYAQNDIAKCVTCGKEDHWKNQQAGHFMSRKYYSTRWDEDNVQVQCAGCNIFRAGEQYKFSLYLGQEKSEELFLKSHKTAKLSNVDLLEMIDTYQQKLSELE